MQHSVTFIRDIHARYGVTNSFVSPDIGQNLDGSNFIFQISLQILINKNYHNYRTSNDIDMKLGRVIKLYKRNTTTVTKFDDDVVSSNYNIIVNIPIMADLEQFRSRILDVWSIILKFAKIMFYLIKSDNRNKKSLTELPYYCIE